LKWRGQYKTGTAHTAISDIRAALRAVGTPRDTPDPPAGEIRRDKARDPIRFFAL
jgi:hypothetical protein